MRILVQWHNCAIYVTINVDRYRAMLNEFLFTKIEEEDIGDSWFQQDSATWHAVEATLDVLRPVFKDRTISSRADVVWPPRSYDLTPLDYYLWGAVKDTCYFHKPRTIDALKESRCIIGPFFFGNEQGETFTVNVDRSSHVELIFVHKN